MSEERDKCIMYGLNQNYLVGKGCDSTDVLLLSYLICIMADDTIKKKIVDNKVFHWINYDKVIKHMPILQLKKDSLYRRLSKLVSKNILEHYTQKDSEGTYSYYRFYEDARLSLKTGGLMCRKIKNTIG